MKEFDSMSRIDRIKNEIYHELAQRVIASSNYYHVNIQEGRGEYIRTISELGVLAICSVTAEEDGSLGPVDEVHLEWNRIERNRKAEFWLRADAIDAQYHTWGEDREHHPITDREPIHPEALMELYEKLFSSRD
jgi:hypothetical protein